MEPTNYLDNPQLTEARNSYQDTAKQANDAQAYGMTLPDMLNDALTKKFSDNNPQVQNREQMLQQYMGAVTSAPLDATYTGAGGNANVIYNPLEQANLIQQRRAVPLAGLSTANYLLGLSQGGIQNTIDATGRAYGAGTQRLLGEADMKRNAYTDLMGEMERRAAQDFQERQFQEGIRQFNMQEGRLGRESGSGGFGGLGDINDFLAGLGLGDEGDSGEPTEMQPMYSPREGFGAKSPGGQWEYSQQYNSWIPVGAYISE